MLPSTHTRVAVSQLSLGWTCQTNRSNCFNSASSGLWILWYLYKMAYTELGGVKRVKSEYAERTSKAAALSERPRPSCWLQLSNCALERFAVWKMFIQNGTLHKSTLYSNCATRVHCQRRCVKEIEQTHLVSKRGWVNCFDGRGEQRHVKKKGPTRKAHAIIDSMGKHGNQPSHCQ